MNFKVLIKLSDRIVNKSSSVDCYVVGGWARFFKGFSSL